MGFRPVWVAFAFVMAILWATSGTQRERAIMTGVTPAWVRDCEANAGAHPEDRDARRELAQAYLAAQQPGPALALLEAAPAALEADARTRHVYARALLDQGRNEDALAVEASVVSSCTPATERARLPEGCDAVVLAAATRRAAILKELVALGVKDARANPELSFVAYQNATHEARPMLH